MLGGEGNENSEKTTIGLIIKKKLCTCNTLFLSSFCRCLHVYNVKLPETSQLLNLWRKCRTCSCSLFSNAAHFRRGGRQHFSFSRHRYNIFMLLFQFLCFLSLAVALCCFFLVELRWLVAYFLFFSVFLFLYFLNLWT